MAVVVRGTDFGRMEFIVHHDINREQLIASIRKQRKNVRDAYFSIGGRLIVIPDLKMLSGTDKAKALTKMHNSIQQQVEHKNEMTRKKIAAASTT